MKAFLFPLILLLDASCAAQTRQDTLRGSNGRGRDWWDVQNYGLQIHINTTDQSISGLCFMSFKVITPRRDSLQIDLQQPLVVDSIKRGDNKVEFAREGNVVWADLSEVDYEVGDTHGLRIYYHGKPRVATNPPWQGGFVWKTDANGKPWVAVACQGLGASSWFPCKDYQGDEPQAPDEDRWSVRLEVDGVPSGVRCLLNGHTDFYDQDSIDAWGSLDRTDGSAISGRSALSFINAPINLYNLTFYLGDYTTFTDTFHGENGVLPLTFHPLRYNEAKARTHFAVVKDMLRCFEHWMGPYPFYEDGYKLVEAPYLGMEHQSAIAYGNKYQMGYLGTDRSGTGVGMLFDYIIIHESGHEWFGNNITAKDVADNWIHEGFTTYTETLYAEWIAGKEKAARYNKGEWKNIDNDRPIIGSYGINDDGSGDKYDKGAAMLHMIRTMLGDDSLFRQLLRGLNKTFWHQTVTTKQVEDFIDGHTYADLRPFFNQYLRTTQIPKLEWYEKRGELHYRVTNIVPGFSLPVRASKDAAPLTVDGEWRKTAWRGRVRWEDNFLVEVEEVRL